MSAKDFFRQAGEYGRNERIGHHGNQPCKSAGLCPLADGGIIDKPGILQNPVVFGQNLPGHNGVPAVKQALLHRNIIPYIYIPGAGSSLDGVPCSAAIQGNGAYTAVKGQNTFVFQQNNTFLCDAGGSLPVCFFAGAW